MSTVSISYSSLRKASGEAKDVAKKLDKYADTLNKSVYKKLDKYEGSWTSNITTARSKASSKIKELRDEADDYKKYAEDLKDLKEECERVDKAVKSKVSSLTASFKKSYGINNNPVVNTICNALTSITNSTAIGRWFNGKLDSLNSEGKHIKQSIEDWYDYGGGKQLIKGVVVAALEIVIGVVGIVGAIVGILAGGWTIALAAALIAGVIGVVNGVVNLVNEGRAFGFADDDPATAKRNSDLNTLSDTLRVKTDSKIWHSFAAGIDTLEIVCSIITIVDGCGKLIKNGYKWATGDLSKLDDLRVKDILTKKNFKLFCGKLKTTFAQGFDEIFSAIKRMDFGYFTSAARDFGTDFLANLKNRFAGFKTVSVDATRLDKLKAIEKNAKTLKNILSVTKDFAKDGWDNMNILEKIVIPCVNVAGVTTLDFPENGGQGFFDFGQITLKDFYDLKDIKVKVFDKGKDLIFSDFIDPKVLDKLTTQIDINISIPEIHIPSIKIEPLPMAA